MIAPSLDSKRVITLPLNKFLEILLSSENRVTTNDLNLAALVQIADPEETFVHVEWKLTNTEKSATIWLINWWRNNTERQRLLKAQSARSSFFSCRTKELVEELAKAIGRKTGLDIEPSMQLASEIIRKRNQTVSNNIFGVSMEDLLILDEEQSKGINWEQWYERWKK